MESPPRLKSLTLVAVVAIAAALAVAGVGAAERDEKPKVFHAAKIWPVSGDQIRNGAMVVENGKIVAVGEKDKITAPAHAETIDLGDATLIPGLVVAQTALSGVGTDNEVAITPQFQAVEGYDALAKYDEILAGGVTTVQLSPGGSRLMPGQGAVVKLAGSDAAKRVLLAEESLRVILGDASKSPPRVFDPPIPASDVINPLMPGRIQLGSTRAGTLALLRATLSAARAYVQGPEVDSQLATIRRYMFKRQAFRVTASEAVDIQAALELAEKYNLVLILVDPVEIFQFKDEYKKFAEKGYSVILKGDVRPGGIVDESPRADDAPKREPVWKIARDLRAAGVAVAIRPAVDSDLNEMLFVGGLFGQGGLSTQQLLELITLEPAKMMRVDNRVGSLAPGLDADFVVLSGDPFATKSSVREVYVDGERVFETAAPKDFTLIKASRVYTPDGQTVKNGSVLVEGSKIRAVGRDVSAPALATVRNYPNASIVAGMIDMRSMFATSKGNSGLQTKLADSLTPKDKNMALARQGGVTTALAIPDGNGPSPVMAFKLGDTPRVLRDPAGIKFTIGGNLTAQLASVRDALQKGKQYAESWTQYDKELAEYKEKLAEYEKKLKEWEEAEKKKKAEADDAKTTGTAKTETPDNATTATAKEGAGRASERGGSSRQPRPEQKQAEVKKEEPKKEEPAKKAEETPAKPEKPKEPKKLNPQSNMEAYRALFASKIPALVQAERTIDIRAAVKLFHDEFKLRCILLGGGDAFRQPELLVDNSIPLLVGPQMVRTVETKQINLAQVIATQGGRVGFGSGATSGAKQLPLAVTYAVRQGLGADDALAAMTAWSAEMLSLGAQIGSLAPGRDADLVVLSGPPFELSSRVLAVMIDGEWVYRSEELE